MSEPSDPIDRRTALLQRLAELAMSSAEDLCARQLAAETPAEAAALASALHRMSRAVRQTLLLEAKFARDDRAEAREAEVQARSDAAEAAKALHGERRVRVRRAMEDVLQERCESQEEVDDLVFELGLRLDDHIRAHDFEAAPFEALIERLCRTLGLDPLPDAAPDEDDTFDAAPPPRQTGGPTSWSAAPDSS